MRSDNQLFAVFAVSVLRVGVGRRVRRFLVGLDDCGAQIAPVDWLAAAAAFGSGTVGPFIRWRITQIGVAAATVVGLIC